MRQGRRDRQRSRQTPASALRSSGRSKGALVGGGAWPGGKRQLHGIGIMTLAALPPATARVSARDSLAIAILCVALSLRKAQPAAQAVITATRASAPLANAARRMRRAYRAWAFAFSCWRRDRAGGAAVVPPARPLAPHCSPSENPSLSRSRDGSARPRPRSAGSCRASPAPVAVPDRATDSGACRVQGRRFGQPAIALRRPGFLIRPGIEPPPHPHQALMRDVDHRLCARALPRPEASGRNGSDRGTRRSPQ